MDKKNKKGWMEVVEVFISVILMSTILLTMVEKNQNNDEESFSDIIYYKQLSILREIETNETLRLEVLNTDKDSLPISWENLPPNIKDKIIGRTPYGLVCIGQICNGNTSESSYIFCSMLEDVENKEVYSQSIKIFSNVAYRDLYLFCWKK